MLDGGWGGELLDLLPGEGDGLPVEGGQVGEQVAVAADGQTIAIALGGGFGLGLPGALGGGDRSSAASLAMAGPSAR